MRKSGGPISSHWKRFFSWLTCMIQCPNKDVNPRSPSQRCGGCSNVMYCSPECQKVDWKAVGGHRLTCLQSQSDRKDGKPHGISCIDYNFFVERCRTDIRIHLDLIRALRAQDLDKQASNSEPVATVIVMNYSGPGNGVKMLRRDISTCPALMGENNWRMLKKAGKQVIIIMQIPYQVNPARFAFPLSKCGISL
ncbi:hypothetical protein ARMSODRAFT_205581 [Armillaria solidipes]|uniref:MYND-type domain-containing protein n=1 Tax=Armillaria solidipes TaxID=1076256 RepID=A0A2H3BR39_9AGAR|nr:hypothetical protein ARMSODRAFT_205581 [Armillaria solidipes]